MLFSPQLVVPVRRAAAAAAAGWSFLISTNASGTNGGTSVGIDTTGAKLIVAIVGSVDSVDPTLTDSNSNTWSGRTRTTSGAASIKTYYVANPTAGLGHTFTISGASSFSTLVVLAFAGGTNATPYDVENGTFGFDASPTAGSITPSVNNELIVAGMRAAQTISSIDGGFTIAENLDFFGTEMGGAYLIQTSAAAANPSWTITGVKSWVANITSFKVS